MFIITLKGHQYISVKYGTWASLVAQTVKNLLAMWEAWVRSLSWEYPLKEHVAIHSSILTWKIPWTEELGSNQEVAELDTTEQLSTHT